MELMSLPPAASIHTTHPLCQPRRKLALRSVHSSVYRSECCICLISSWAARAGRIHVCLISILPPAPHSARTCPRNEGRQFYPYFLPHPLPLFCGSDCSLSLVWIFITALLHSRSPEDSLNAARSGHGSPPTLTQSKSWSSYPPVRPRVAAIWSLSISPSTVSLAHSVPPTTDPLQFPEPTSLHGCLSVCAPPHTRSLFPKCFSSTYHLPLILSFCSKTNLLVKISPTI